MLHFLLFQLQFMNASAPTVTIQNQSGGTCYAHASARLMLHSWLRVSGVKVPSYNTLVNAIIKKYGKNGGRSSDVIDYFGDPDKRWLEPEFKDQFVEPSIWSTQSFLQSIPLLKSFFRFGSKTSTPREVWRDYPYLPKLRCIFLNMQDFKDAAKFSLIKQRNRPILLCFYLSEKRWEKFRKHYESFPDVPLEEHHMTLDTGVAENLDKISGHGVVIDITNSHFDCLVIKNSWGNGWASGGCFRVKDLSALMVPGSSDQYHRMYLIEIVWDNKKIHDKIKPFSKDPIRIPELCWSDLVLSKDKKLGEGGDSIVYEMQYANEVVAVKETLFNSSNRDLHFGHLEHPHILRVLGYITNQSTPYVDADTPRTGPEGAVLLLMEKADGTLKELRKDMSPDEQQKALHGVLLALEFLAKSNICHRDVKPDNIFRVNGMWKLGDFGISTSNTETIGGRGTRGWTDPAIMNSQPEDTTLTHLPQYDMYSIGCLVNKTRNWPGLAGLPESITVASLQAYPSLSICRSREDRRGEEGRGAEDGNACRGIRTNQSYRAGYGSQRSHRYYLFIQCSD